MSYSEQNVLEPHHLHVLWMCLASLALNLSRLLSWLMGVPLDGTRVSRFAALAA